MGYARELIAIINQLESTEERHIARFVPSLVGIFGSRKMLSHFLKEMDLALSTQVLTPDAKARVNNLLNTFIPQIGALNGLNGVYAEKINPDQLRNVSVSNPAARLEGVKTILISFLNILDEADSL